jgi:hypothetical protein
MCNKLIVLSVALVVAGFCVPVPAAYIGFDDSGNSGVNPLKVDIGGGGVTPTLPGWQYWVFQSNWTGPTADMTFTDLNQDYSWEQPTATMNVYRKNQVALGANPNVGLSRSREGGFAGVAGTGDFSNTTEGYGMNYVQLTLDGLAPDQDYKIWVWDFENSPTWSMASNNPDSKFTAWSTTNPKQWLDSHVGQYQGIGDGTHDPNGYGPIVGDQYSAPRTDSNMPGTETNPYTGTGPSLWQLTLGRVNEVAYDTYDHLGENQNDASFHVTTDDYGNVVLYAWEDFTDWTGSAHVPVNGFEVIPEPATLLLLGLGGLALLRKRRT